MLVIDQVVGILNAIYQFGSLAVSTVRNLRDVALGSKQYDVAEVDDQTDEQKESEEKKKGASKASYYIDKMNSVVPGFGTFVNYVFSPNVALVLGLIGVAASFFSPLGVGVGAATVALLGTLTVAGIFLGGYATKQLDIQKQTTSVVKEIEKDGLGIEKQLQNLDSINKKMGVNIDVSKIVSGSIAGSLSQMSSVMEKTVVEKPGFLKSVIGGIATRFPINGFMLGTGIATLNPLTIGIMVPVMILGEAASIRQDRANVNANVKYEEEMADRRHKFGLPEIEGEEGLKTYTATLSELKRTKNALARFERDYESILTGMAERGITPTEDNLRGVFQNQYLATEPYVDIPTHVMSYGEALAQSFNNGWTWSKSMDAKSPFVEQYEWAYNDNAYKYSAVQQEVKANMPGKSEEQVAAKTSEVIKDIEKLKQDPNAEVSEDAKAIHAKLQEKKVEVGGVLDDMVEASKPKHSFVERETERRQSHGVESQMVH